MVKRKSAKRSNSVSAGSATGSSNQTSKNETATISSVLGTPKLRPVEANDTPIDDEVEDEEDEEEEKEVVKRKKIHQSRRVVFILGALIGLFLAVFFSTNSHDSLQKELEKLVNYDSVSGILDDWRDVLPSGIQSLISDIEISSSTKEEGQLHGSADSFSVGKRMVLQQNLTEVHNVVMVPGVISTGIESWGLDSIDGCQSEPYFRKRLWGSFYMLRTMVLDKACWLKHIMLDPETGLDPPNIKLRAAQGFEAADFFLAGYWIWNKILQNLAVIGYGPNNMISASYDWRLAYLDLQKRDGYFTKLKNQIETMKYLNGQKSILVGHSMGVQVIYYFMKWVEAEGELYGNGGSSWCNDHLEAMVDISGSSLGAPKAIPALLSGEMKDTIQLNALAVYGLEKFFSRKERVDMLRSFGGIPSMLPKGGELIWGNLTYAPDDPLNTLETDVGDEQAVGMEKIDENTQKNDSFGTFIRLKNSVEGEGDEDQEVHKKFTINESIDYLLDTAPDWFSNRVREQYSFGIAKTKEELERNNQDHSKWSNPLEAALPNAPDMKMYCFYGVGNPTERAYAYQKADAASKLDITIDTEAEIPVYFGDGDGTISLLTHTMCHEWQKGSKSRFNPGNMSITIVEIKHEPDRFDIRGGAKTAEHVDILGSAELNELVLKVAAGKGHTIENRYVSKLQKIVEGFNI
ncbi:phospholipid:diacylglycerol acyltransferase [[Candida] railenensis]|uniref:Phospholipid:diacylglycerol acyltransferase n=1 Tax=[Candida] railenensis TaxID=45579 RepID=A0A9P0QVW9_9ASCO|nr:phospholipid:diacylglycerol acyltransferase [[Candida] railenensis]